MQEQLVCADQSGARHVGHMWPEFTYLYLNIVLDHTKLFPLICIPYGLAIWIFSSACPLLKWIGWLLKLVLRCTVICVCVCDYTGEHLPFLPAPPRPRSNIALQIMLQLSLLWLSHIHNVPSLVFYAHSDQIKRQVMESEIKEEMLEELSLSNSICGKRSQVAF